MTVVFAGGELDAFSFFGDVIASTSSSRRDPDFARVSMRPRLTGFIQADFAPLTEGWLHFNVNIETLASGNQDSAIVQLIDSNTSQSVILLDGDDGIFNLEYWNGSSFTEIATNILFVVDVTHKVDIHWKIANSGGFFELYLDGTLISSFTGDTLLTGFTQIDQLHLHSSSGVSSSSLFDTFYSEVIVATDETIGWRLATVVPDGIGNGTAWTGDNNDIDEALNDTSFISSSTAEEIEQFTVSDLISPAAELNIEAVVVAARSRNAITGPQNVQVSIRTDGNDFFSSNILGLSTGFTPGLNIWEQNPDTSSDWILAEINALQIGVKSKV